jgi:hypothetical protein
MISLVMNDEHISFSFKETSLKCKLQPRAFRGAGIQSCSLSGLNGRNAERLLHAPNMALTKQGHPPLSTARPGHLYSE